MKKLQNKKGFTLTEMIVVLAIIGILIALLAPNVARLIQNAQTTSDNAKAKTAMTAGLTYGTDAIASGVTLDPTAAEGLGLIGAAGNKDSFYIVALENTDAKFTQFYYAALTAPSFMDKTGDSLLPDNTVRGTDVIYFYISSEGAIMGTVSTSAGNVIKAVTGTAPTAVQTALGALTPAAQFTTGDLRKGTIDTTTGVITPAV